MTHTHPQVTLFQDRVYRAVSEIPRGKVSTYGLVARHIGCGSPRAVGQALRRNPFAPQVPCHRVIASDLRIGGFSGHRSGKAVARKLSLLAKEKVRFAGERLADPGQVHRFGMSIA